VFNSQIKKTVLLHSRISVIALIMACLLAFSQSSIAETANLVIKGSITILPIARSIAEEFEHQCENVTVKVSGGGSAEGIIGSRQTMMDVTYLIKRPLFMFTSGWPGGRILEFINFVPDPNKGQVMIEDAEYILL